MEIRKYMEKDISAMVYIWNKVVEDGEAFPQEDFLNDKTGADFFAAQTYCGVADDNGKIVGLYILHPNNIGRCGHIANASYAVATDYRGEHIGEPAQRIGIEETELLLLLTVIKSCNQRRICSPVNDPAVTGVAGGDEKVRSGQFA